MTLTFVKVSVFIDVAELHELYPFGFHVSLEQPPEAFYKKGALKKFFRIHLKTPAWSLFFNKMRLRHRWFRMNFA